MIDAIFSQETELKRLAVQGRLLKEYEQLVYQQVINKRNGLMLLDVGCNDGRKTTDRFSEENFTKIIGVDSLKRMINQANKQYGNDVRTFYDCDIATPNFSERLQTIMDKEKVSTFDIINCSFLLMHLENPGKVLRQLREFLAPDGCLVVIEPDDTESYMKPDEEGLFERFLEILADDPYAGNRRIGGELPELFIKNGYLDYELKNSEICASGSELSKKADIFTTFCSYLPEDLMLLKSQEPENNVYQRYWEWLQENYEKLYRKAISEMTTFSIGIKIYICRGAK